MLLGRLAAVAALIVMVGCQPPGEPTTTSTTSTTSSTTTTTTSTSVPVGLPGLPVDPASIPAPHPGATSHVIEPAAYPWSVGDGSAAFRINCHISHSGWNDPILYPGQANASHLHTFAGNTGTDSTSTPDSIRTGGGSTCSGGTANRSAYWAPTVIDTATGRVVPSGWVGGHELQVYYKTGYQGVSPYTVQNYPVGLRMIAGDAKATGPVNRPTTHGAFASCDEGGPHEARQGFPICAPGGLLLISVQFPQCWDGRNLDSPDHKSHMAYGAGWPDKGCPPSHPVPLAEITQNYRYRVPPTGMETWRLSSDTYAGPPGYSGHADWMNGWDPAVFQRVVDNCYHQGLDCSMNLLGDGTMLGWVP